MIESVAARVSPPKEAVSVAVAVTPELVVTVKLAELAPERTVTLDGTDADAESLSCAAEIVALSLQRLGPQAVDAARRP